jgi:hypothetical protein
MDRSVLIDKIRKLRAIEEKTCYEGEATSARAMAESLMKKYKISEEEIKIWLEQVQEVSIELEDKLRDWEINLVVATAKELNCMPIQRSRRYEDDVCRYGIAFVGTKKDVETAIRIFNWVREEVQRIAHKHEHSLMGLYRLDILSLLFGMSEAVYMKVVVKERMKKKTVEEEKVEEAVNEYVDSKHQNIGGNKEEERKLSERLDALSYRIGLDLGQYVDLSDALERKQLTS